MLLAPRHLPRLAAMVGLFTRYGLRDFARQQGLEALAPEEFTEADEETGTLSGRAVAFRERLVELGPAYIKLGQVLSTRPDLLPEPYIRELSELQDDVPPIPLDAIEQVIEEELGARLSKLFTRFDPEPLGTASLGQVHAAALRDGRDVVVKVQRPGIREQLADDIAFFRELAGFLGAHTAAGQRVDMLGIVQQLERALVDELDYRVEARNAAAFRRSLAEFTHIVIPRVIEAYTTPRVLTTERVRGLKIDELSPLTRIEHDLRPLAEEFARAYLKQITIDGHFHADPHPGNVFILLPETPNPRTPAELADADRRAAPREVESALSRIEADAQRRAPTPAPRDELRLALIDFGMTARISAAFREQIVSLLLGIADNRGDEAAEVLIEMGQPLEEFDRKRFTGAIATLVARSYDMQFGDVQAGRVLHEAIDTSYRHGLRLPAELTLLAKALFNLDGVTRALDPTYTPIEAIRAHGNRMMDERARSELSPRRIFQIARSTSDMLSRLPHRLDVITQHLAANDFALRIDAPQLDTLLQGLQKVANRIFTGLVLTGILVASGMMYAQNRALGLAGFVIAAAVALYMVTAILISDRRRRPPG